MPSIDTVVLVAGGDSIPPGVHRFLPPADLVIAADSGLDHAVSLGLRVDLVIGDMDSVQPDTLARLSPDVAVEEFPVAKDATDLELALERALARHPRRLVVLGGHGGRIDHLLANVGLLADSRLAGVDVTWWAGADLVIPVRDHLDIAGTVGHTVSLIPIGGPAVDVTTRGLEWELAAETLLPGSTRGVSNRFREVKASVEVTDGVLVVAIPAAIGQ